MDHQKQSILDNTNKGLTIFETYIPELKINGTAKNFRALFRDDGHNADANVFFNEKSQIWCYNDFVNGETYNPFDFVMKYCNCDFKTALKVIKEDIMGSYQIGNKSTLNTSKSITEFELMPGDNINYWLVFAPEEKIKETLKEYKVQSLQSYSIIKGGKKYTISAEAGNPIFAFKISETCYKIYRPYAIGKQTKHLWIGKKPDTYFDVFGMDKLPDFSEFIIIVEGLKDVITSNANGISAVGVDNAATRIRSQDIKTLKEKCKHLLICYDIDKPGVVAAEKIVNEHGIRRLILPETLLQEKGKDISDFFQLKHSAEEIFSLIEETVKTQASPVVKIVKEKIARLSKFEQVEKIIAENFELRYNEVSNEIEYRRKDSLETEFDILNENNVYRFLQHNNIEFSMAKLTSLLRSDFVSRYNPFRSYFEALSPWDINLSEDYIKKLCTYLPTKDNARFQIQFVKTLVRTVACALNNTIINKQSLILVHEEQNSGKTTFIRWLCPPALNKYIAENISTDKDSLIALSDNLIINMDELATLSRAEINTLKSMFSKETIKVRRPYDKIASSAPRRASFFGSTNKAEFLTDETGSVRWQCFELTDRINWDYNKDLNIDDIWRQAYSLYKNGFKYELTAEEIRENELANMQYQITTTEIEMIQKYYSPGSKEKHDAFYQATDFLNNLVEKCPTARLNPNNIGKALKVLGFERISKRSEKYPVKGYYITFII